MEDLFIPNNSNNDYKQKSATLRIGDSAFKAWLVKSKHWTESSKAVEISLEINNASPGIGFELVINYRNLNVGVFQISSFGTTHVNFSLLNYVDGSELRFILVANKIHKDYQLNKFDDGNSAIEINKASYKEVSQPYDLRKDIVLAARDTSRKLGLVGDYMKGEKEEKICTEILSSIADGRGLSIVRLGDGEGRILARPGFFNAQELFTQTFSYHFGSVSNRQCSSIHGLNWISNSIKEICNTIEASVRNADFLGLPVFEYFQSFESDPVSGHFGYAAALISALEMQPTRDLRTIIGTNAFQLSAQRNTLFATTLPAAKDFSIVGPWDLRKEIHTALPNSKIGDYIEAQQHYTFREEISWGQYPLHWKATEQKINDLGDLRGRVFLIAAGLLGKHYCNIIKLQGGIALDIGSVLDSWAKRGRKDAILSSEKINFSKLIS